MVVPVVLSPGAFEMASSNDAKPQRMGFMASCSLLLLAGSLSFVAGETMLGIWQLLMAMLCSLTLRKTTPSIVLLIASLFAVDLLSSLISLVEIIPRFSFGDPPIIYREPKALIAVIFVRPLIAAIFLTTSLLYYFALMRFYQHFSVPNLLFPATSPDAEVRFHGEGRVFEDLRPC